MTGSVLLSGPGLIPQVGIGMDFSQVYQFGEAPLASYRWDRADINTYPPLVTWMIYPTRIFSEPVAIRVWQGIILASFLFFLLAAIPSDRRKELWPSVFILWICSLQTFPVQFAVERANSDLIVTALSAGIVLGWGWLAIILGSVSAVHFKLYPAILLSFLIVRRQWKLLLVCSLFIGIGFLTLGTQGFIYFYENLSRVSHERGMSFGPAHHNFYGLVGNFGSQSVDLVKGLGISLILAFAWIFFRTVRRPDLHNQIALLGTSFGLMSLLPGISYDYKLGIHLFPYLIALTRISSVVWASLITVIVALAMGPSFPYSKAIWVAGLFFAYFAFSFWTRISTTPQRDSVTPSTDVKS